MNAFEAMSVLASQEKWCWNLNCTTCGQLHFRFGLVELTQEKHPFDHNWVVKRAQTNYSVKIGQFPYTFTSEQQRKIVDICITADLVKISKNCVFPDWLGYLGLVLTFTKSDPLLYKKLCTVWSSQLARMVRTDSLIYKKLNDAALGVSVLDIKDLEHCENNIISQHKYYSRDSSR
ncbi:hypothetical protein BM527_05595 [Alteromonas sp. Mex14]|nr:hypothetical protein BM527_05595 [Alteromonas sp. Mex14]